MSFEWKGSIYRNVNFTGERLQCWGLCITLCSIEFWKKRSSFVQSERHTPKLNVFCALSWRKVYGPLFFIEANITGMTYRICSKNGSFLNCRVNQTSFGNKMAPLHIDITLYEIGWMMLSLTAGLFAMVQMTRLISSGLLDHRISPHAIFSFGVL